mgnify:CR=1 FL=1
MGRAFFVIRFVDGAISQYPWRQTLAAVALFRIKLPELRKATRPIYVRLGILPEE